MVTDLNGFWKMKSDNEIFQIEQIDDESFKVTEKDTHKSYEFHLSFNSEINGQINGGNITSSHPFWNNKRIFFKSKDSFTLTGQFQGGQSWYFERTEEFE